MKSNPRQVSSSRSREGRREAVARANRMKADLNLALSPQFDQDYGPYGKSGNPAGFFTYTHLGYEIRLRFNQVSYEWLATCPHFDIEKTFPHQSPQDIQTLLNDWLLDHINPPTSPQALLRQSTPAVNDLAQRHGISVNVADEMLFERGF